MGTEQTRRIVGWVWAYNAFLEHILMGGYFFFLARHLASVQRSAAKRHLLVLGLDILSLFSIL